MAETTTASSTTKSSGKSGCGPMTFIVILVLIAMVVFGGNEALGIYGMNCGDMDIFDCADEIMSNDDDEKVEGTVAATGPYTYKGHSVSITLNIPLKGGAVTGSISGDCNGKVSNGTYDGADNGAISGNLAGTCDVFLLNVPAKAAFGGTVNKDSKVVPISFDGGGGGITHQGSLSLSY